MTAADSAVQPQTRQALRWFGRVTDGQYQDALDGTTVRRQVDTDPHFDERRSFARSAEKEVVISVESPRPQIVSTVHELAHVMEHHNPDLLNRAAEYGRWRVARGWWRTNPDLHPSFQDYGVKAYFQYGGRVRATEIVTMGLEQMHEDPGGFARRDPDWWMFIYAHVLRRWPDVPPIPAISEAEFHSLPEDRRARFSRQTDGSYAWTPRPVDRTALEATTDPAEILRLLDGTVETWWLEERPAGLVVVAEEGTEAARLLEDYPLTPAERRDVNRVGAAYLKALALEDNAAATAALKPLARLTRRLARKYQVPGVI